MIRLHLILGMISALLLYLTVTYNWQSRFKFEDVAAIAAAESQKKYVEPSQDIPPFLRNLNYDQNRDIRWKDDFTLWRRESLPFQIKFFHRTGRQPEKIDVYTIDGTKVQRVIYSPQQFDYGKNQFTDPIPANLGFSGFRVHYPLNKKEYLDELIVFLGGCYFRALGKDQQYGLSARALALNSGMPNIKEEFPRFTRFWLRKPKQNARSLQLYALLEGPSIVGAYEFTIIPGEATKIEVHGKLYTRKKIERLGLAPLTSMYWFGENYRADIRDFRPEIHDSDGLLIHNRKGEWLWRPLSNGHAIRENSFIDENPIGFGLLQRDRDFKNYQDLESHYQDRPSVWIEAKTPWGRGKIDLIQFPTNDETNDNIVAFWTPETPVEAGMIIDYQYTMYWYANDTQRPPLATVVGTRIHYPLTNEPVLFVIDFTGGGLDKIPEGKVLRAEVETSPPGLAQKIIVAKNDYAEGWRVTFSCPANSNGDAVELRCRIFLEDRPLSEIWTYTWKPER